MSTLRSRIIRAAAADPKLRQYLIPILRSASLDALEVLKGNIPAEVMADLQNGLSNGIGFAAADYVADMPKGPEREQVSAMLWKTAIRDFAQQQGLSCEFPKTAGNMGEELNPFMLDTDDLTWEVVNDALLGEIEMVAGKVGSLVMTASRKGLSRAGGVATEDTMELYNSELKARLIAIINRILPD